MKWILVFLLLSPLAASSTELKDTVITCNKCTTVEEFVEKADTITFDRSQGSYYVTIINFNTSTAMSFNVVLSRIDNGVATKKIEQLPTTEKVKEAFKVYRSIKEDFHNN
jgi:hypothetical protein